MTLKTSTKTCETHEALEIQFSKSLSCVFPNTSTNRGCQSHRSNFSFASAAPREQRTHPPMPSVDIVVEPGAGYGMRATHALPRGTVVLREKPLASMRADDFQTSLESLWPELQSLRAHWHKTRQWPDEIHAPPEVIQRFAARVYSTLPQRQQQRWMSLADSLSEGEATTPGGVALTNSITDAHTGDNYLFPTISRANHSCAPNMKYTLPSHDGEEGSLLMLSDAAAGDALTISYLSADDLAKPTDERRALLRTTFNFECQCARCRPAAVPASDMVPPSEVLPPQARAAHEPQVMNSGEIRQTPFRGATASANAVAALDAAQSAICCKMEEARAQWCQPCAASTSAQLLEVVRACAEAIATMETTRQAFLLSQ